MHDRPVVVGADVVPVGDLLVEVVVLPRVDIRTVDGHERVAVLAALLVPQSDGVPDLVDGLTEEAAAGEVDVLQAALPADR